MQPLTARTKLVGLIGWPVGHSVSPKMHNAAFEYLGLDWRYVPLPVNIEPTERISEAVAGLRALGFQGANVTVPHKQSVIRFLDKLTDAAAAIGAVNTIQVCEDGSLLGDNTDAPGFIADLRDNDIDPYGQQVTVLGAGGSARAVVFGLAEAGASSITIVNRTASRAVELASAMQGHFDGCDIQAAATDADEWSPASIVVNCTSVGMTPNTDAMPWSSDKPFRPDQRVYDLVYNPSPTKLSAFAAASGAHAVNGIGMLFWQGAIAFKRWTGLDAPVDMMRAAIVSN